MVSAVQLQQQQAQLRETRAGLSLQQQQQALRQGITPQQFIRREEERIRKQVQTQITRELKTQASKIDNILKNVNSISQFNELFSQIPTELRRFVKTTETQLRADLQNRIKAVEKRISSRRSDIISLRETRAEAIKDNNTERAIRLEAERRGLEKEVGFLTGEILPRFRRGELLPLLKVFSVARDVALSEEEKRRAVETQLTQLATKLEGGRRELSEIIRTQQVTQAQAVQLGFSQAQAPMLQPEIMKELPPPRELLPKEVTQTPQIQKRFVNKEDLLPEFRDVFQEVTPEQISRGDILGRIAGVGLSNFAESTGLGGFAGIDVGGLGVLGIGIQPSGVTPTAKPIFEELEKGIGFVREEVIKPIREKEAEVAEIGIKIPTKQEQLDFPKRETLEFKPEFLTDEEIKAQTFGGGLDVLSQQRVRETKVELGNIANSESDKLLPSFQKRAQDKTNELQKKVNAGKISVEEANIELTNFTDKLNKEFQNQIQKKLDKESKLLSDEINKEITDAFKRNQIKRELLLLPVTIATGFALGFAGGISPVIAGGLTAFGLTQVAKATPIVVTAVKTGDVQTLGAIGVQVTGFAIGGLIGAKIGGKFIQSVKISNAIKRANVRSEITARDLEVLRKLKLPPQLRSEIKTLIDRGFSIRLVETKLIARSLADGKILPDVRGRFLEIVNRQGKVVDVISIGTVISRVGNKVFSQDIISESVGKIEGTKSQFVTRSIIGKLKGDKFKPISEVRTFQETTLVGRQVTPTKELTLTESITKFIAEGKIKGKKVDISKIQKGFLGDTFGLKSLKEFPSEFLIKGKKIIKIKEGFNLKALESALVTGAKGKVISKTGVIGVRKIVGGDVTVQKLVSTQKGKGFQVSADIGDLLTSLKQFETKVFGLTINVPAIKITKPKPRDTLKEVFGTEVSKFEFPKFPKFDFKKFFKTKEGQILQQQTKQINQNLDLLTQTTTPGVITKVVAKVKPAISPVFVTGKIAPFEDLGKVQDLGVLGGRIITGLETKQELKEKQKGRLDLGLLTGLASGLETEQERKQRLKTGLLFPDITKVIQDLGQIPKTSPILAQIQPQTQLQLQLQKLKTNLAGFGVSPPTISIITPKIDIPFVFTFPKIEKPRKQIISELDKGYNVFVKSKGVNKKVNKVPLMENIARDLGSWVVDNTLSAEFSIKKAKGKPRPPKVIVPNNYFNRNTFKFRNFIMKQGKVIPLKNKYIERKERRLDSVGEVRNITIARLLKQKPRKNKDMDRISRNLNKIFGV